jgi:hypothetical protein
MSKFHWKDRVFFERTEDGSVKVTLGGDWDVPGYDLFTIDRNAWASIVASVSDKGEDNGRFYEALKFHGEPEAADA